MNVMNDIYKSVNMYEMPTIYDFNDDIVLPQTMYKMPDIYGTSLQMNPIDQQMNGTNDLVDSNDFEDIDKQLALNPLKDLLSRQQILLKRLEALDKGLDSLNISKSSEQIVNKSQSNERPKKSVEVLSTFSAIGCSDEALDAIKDVVIFSDINRLPLSVLSLVKLMKSLGLKVLLKFHFHSSLHLTNDSHFERLNQSLSSIDLNYKLDIDRLESRLENHLIVTIILKDISEHQMILSPIDSIPITSEANILRFMARIAAKLRPKTSHLYEGIEDISRLTAVDQLVDEINAKIFVKSVMETKYDSEMDSHLSRNSYLCGKSLTIADLLLWSGLNHYPNLKLKTHLDKWFNAIKQFILTPTPQLF